VNNKTEKSYMTKMSSFAISGFLTVLLIGAFAIIPAANPAVSYNPETKQGFIGKGDV
jgi:hypothetical protein